MPLNRPQGLSELFLWSASSGLWMDGDRIEFARVKFSCPPSPSHAHVCTHTLSGPPSHFVAMLAFSLALSHLALGLSLLCRAPHWAAPDAYLVSPGKESHSTLLTGT